MLHPTPDSSCAHFHHILIMRLSDCTIKGIFVLGLLLNMRRFNFIHIDFCTIMQTIPIYPCFICKMGIHLMSSTSPRCIRIFSGMLSRRCNDLFIDLLRCDELLFCHRRMLGYPAFKIYHPCNLALMVDGVLARAKGLAALREFSDGHCSLADQVIYKHVFVKDLE